MSFTQNLFRCAYYNINLLLVIDCLGGFVLLCFSEQQFYPSLVLSDLISQAGLFHLLCVPAPEMAGRLWHWGTRGPGCGTVLCHWGHSYWQDHMLWDTQNSRRAMNLNVSVPRAIATFQTGWLYFASTSIRFQQLHTKTSSLSVPANCKSCLIPLCICCVLICKWLWFSIMVDLSVSTNEKDCFYLTLPLLWLFLVSLLVTFV